jgi:hypothetical protein
MAGICRPSQNLGIRNGSRRAVQASDGSSIYDRTGQGVEIAELMTGTGWTAGRRDILQPFWYSLQKSTNS